MNDEEETLIVNEMEIRPKCFTCERDGTSPVFRNRRELDRHLDGHGKIITPKRHEDAGHIRKKKDGDQ